MPTVYTPSQPTATSAGFLNALRSLSSPEYQAGVPVATDTLDSLKQIGQEILAYQSRTNEFIDTLVGRIGMEVYSHYPWKDPWGWCNQGTLEMGEAIEEIYVHMALPYIYKVADDGATMSEVINMYKPKVSTAFHSVNCQVEYPITITYDMIRRAFLTMDGVRNLVMEIIKQVWTAVNHDVFCMKKYVIQRLVVDGKLPVIKYTPGADKKESAANLVEIIKATSNNFIFNKSDYNIAKVPNSTPKEDQYVILSSEMDATVDVNVLASAFNMDKVEFAGHKTLVDDWKSNDWARLKFIMKDNFEEFTNQELSRLDGLEGMLLDKAALMCFDNLLTTRAMDLPNLMRNEFVHVWKIYSFSPFKNAVFFSAEDSEVTKVSYNTTAPAQGKNGATINRSVASFTTTGNPSLIGKWYWTTNSNFNTIYEIVPGSNNTWLDVEQINNTAIRFSIIGSGSNNMYIAYIPDGMSNSVVSSSHSYIVVTRTE